MIDVTFLDCRASQGGALWTSSALRLVNVTFAGNGAIDPTSAVDDGGAAYFDGISAVDVSNVVAWANFTDNLLGERESSIAKAAGASANVANSLLEKSGGSASWNPAYGNDLGGNLDLDPQFVSLATGDLRLLARSPAVDAGDAALRPAGFDVDLQGAPRVCGPALDMGALEFQGIDCAPFDGNWFVATTGSDDGNGLADEAFASLGHAVGAAAAGDTINVGAGPTPARATRPSIWAARR